MMSRPHFHACVVDSLKDPPFSSPILRILLHPCPPSRVLIFHFALFLLHHVISNLPPVSRSSPHLWLASSEGSEGIRPGIRTRDLRDAEAFWPLSPVQRCRIKSLCGRFELLNVDVKRF